MREALDHSWGRLIVGVISELEYEIANNIKGLEMKIIKAYETKTNDPKT